MKNSPYKKDFPIFSTLKGDKPLVYLDSAATTQKPEVVLHKMEEYYCNSCASPHRGTYELSEISTALYEESKQKVAELIGAPKQEQIIYTKNASESINLVAYSYGLAEIQEGDEVVVSILEHHSNLVPWQMVCQKKRAKLVYMYTDENGEISPAEVEKKITEKTKLVAITHVSNALGNIVDVKFMIDYAHQKGAKVLVDGTQAVPHRKVDVTELDVDFYVFSGHKMLGPTGIGVLYGKEELLEKMNPFLLGGDMIEYVSEQETTFGELPNKFEAGTQNVVGAVGLGAAIDYMNEVGYETIHEVETELFDYAMKQMKEIPYLTLYGSPNAKHRAGTIAFTVQDIHPHDVASILGHENICIRAGHYCAQPLGKFLGVTATCRISFHVYNDKNDVDCFIQSLKSVRKWLGYES